eukprot:358978-Chlamydomonas_euryale.AAC.2
MLRLPLRRPQNAKAALTETPEGTALVGHLSLASPRATKLYCAALRSAPFHSAPLRSTPFRSVPHRSAPLPVGLAVCTIEIASKSWFQDDKLRVGGRKVEESSWID